MTGAAPRPRALHVCTVAEFFRHIVLSDLRFLRERMDVTLACADGPAVASLRAEGFRVVTFPIRRKLTPVADLRAITALTRVLRRERVDLLHSYVPKGGLVGQVAGTLARVPRRIQTWQGILHAPSMPRWQRIVLPATDRLINRLAHRVIYVSHGDLTFSIENGLCDPAKARFTGSGIDVERYDPAALPAEAGRQVRERLGIPPDAFVALSVGRFVADKGFRELADAAARLVARHDDLWFIWIAPVLAGEDGVLPDALARRPDLRGRVLKLPAQDDVRPYYRAADVFVHPSYREGVPKVLMEAAAMGLPIAASDIPGCREVLTDGDTGLLFPPRNVDRLTAALEEVYAGRAAARRRADAARRDVRQRFDQRALAERIGAVYEELGVGERPIA